MPPSKSDPRRASTADSKKEHQQRPASHRHAAGVRRARVCGEEISHEPLPLACDESSSSSRTEVEAADAATLLRGKVPTAAEWRAGWALLSEASSLRKGARMRRKHLSTTAESEEERTRKRRRKQLRVMADVLRVRIREVLRNATSICLSLDESRYVKIVRYRADVPAPGGERGVVRNVWASGYCHAGVLGILDCQKGHAAEFEEGNF